MLPNAATCMTIAEMRQRAAAGTFTTEQYKEVIAQLRSNRKSAMTVAEKPEKAKKVEKLSLADLLDQIEGL